LVVPARGPRCAIPAGWAAAIDHAIWHNAVPNLGVRDRVGTITGCAMIVLDEDRITALLCVGVPYG
jgi:hypothetical protein